MDTSTYFASSEGTGDGLAAGIDNLGLGIDFDDNHGVVQNVGQERDVGGRLVHTPFTTGGELVEVRHGRKVARTSAPSSRMNQLCSWHYDYAHQMSSEPVEGAGHPRGYSVCRVEPTERSI